MASRLAHQDPASACYLKVDLARQRLDYWRAGRRYRSYVIATAKNGAGERSGSECTPRGWHRIRAKIGGGLPLGSVLVGRRPTGEIYDEELAARFPQRDWILSRILWLSGLQPGFNRFGEVDSARRYIYVHGSPDREVAGIPNSHGCVRMKNADIIELFEHIRVNTRIYIG